LAEPDKPFLWKSSWLARGNGQCVDRPVCEDQRHHEIIRIALIPQPAVELATAPLGLLELWDSELRARGVHVIVRRIVVAGPVLQSVRPLDDPNLWLPALPQIGSRSERGVEGLQADEDALDRERRTGQVESDLMDE